MKKNNLFYFLVCISLVACGGDSLSPFAYVQWVENVDNGLKSEKIVDDYKFSLQYQPVEYTIVNELKQEEITTETLNKEKELRKGLQYFIFKMATIYNKPVFSGLSNTSDSIVNYLNAGIQHDFYVLEKGDTLPCKLFHYENTNGMTPYDSFVLGFESFTDSINDKTFLFKASVLQLEWIEMKIKATAINKVPKLKTI